ncbi:transglycosylase-like protein with SLT domain [Crenobacter luteus]|uniref:lytic transglycosylase domain-containing protein n=1 Tax=Crenobacter luteus TaxID=1452487 RepID=UPI0010F21979|nr:lytic transglycosylase domain-containing protein [Crenobacter luteus]TCP10618.1 transglycosylase-like protein with SLT domain [Crenobacter luteus]
MKARMAAWQAGMATTLALSCVAPAVADVYRSERPDGLLEFTSQAHDSSYQLYLRDAPPAQPSRVAKRGKIGDAPSGRKHEVHALIEKFSRKHAVDSALVRAVVEVESKGNIRAVSPKGAIGAMQLMPATAAMYGVTDATDPAQNIEAGILHLKYLLSLHKGNLPLTLAAYNAGEGTVSRYSKRIPPYRETMLYVAAVLARLQSNNLE